MYSLEIKPKLNKKLSKISKKNRKLYEIIMKKAKEILKNPEHYKNLKAPLQEWKRVHIGHFVLAFSVKGNSVILEDFDHHNNIYQRI